MTSNKQYLPLILAGAGHAHLVLFRQWLDMGYRPPAGTVLVNPEPQAWYSGMMPGLMAGRYQASDCAIELAPWCQALGVELLLDEVEAVDARQAQLTLSSGRQVSWNLLSINTGSQPPAPAHNDGSIQVVPAKPFSALHQAWLQWCDRAQLSRLGVLGGGAAAVELALALHASLPRTQIHLLSAHELLSGHPYGLAERARQLLLARGVVVHEHTEITGIRQQHVSADSRPVCQLDVLVLATGAAPLPWYADSGMECDERGFLCVTPTLQSTSHPNILVSGDSASVPGSKKSGVYSVRHGPILAKNIEALLQGRELTFYHPQKKALALLSTADGGALVNIAGWTLGGSVPGRWKDWLDRRFMDRHRLR